MSLSAKQKVLLRQVKAAAVVSEQSGEGIISAISGIVKLINILGPVNKLLWNSAVIPILKKTVLRSLSPAQRQRVGNFLKIGRGSGAHRGGRALRCKIVRGRLVVPSRGLKLAGQGLKLAGQGLKLAGQGHSAGLKLAGQGSSAGLKLAGQGRSLGAKRSTLARRQRLGPKRLTRKNVSGLRRGTGSKAGAAKNPWLKHVKKFRKSHPGMSYKMVLQNAAKTYKK